MSAPAPDPENAGDAATQARYRARPLAFAILLAGIICMGMGQTIVFAVLPPIARDLGFGDFQVLAVFMISAMFWVTAGPFWGRLSDQYGRRLFILIGIIGFMVSMLMFAGAIRLGVIGAMSGFALYALILATRCVYGIIGSAQPPAAAAYIADRTGPEERAKGLAGITAAFGLGSTMGPAFAGLLAPLGPLAPLFGVAGIAGIAGGLVFFLLPENNPPKMRVAPPKVAMRDPRIFSFLAFGLIGGAVAALPIQMMGFFLIDVLNVPTDEALAKASIPLTAGAAAALFAQIVLVGRFSMSPSALLRWGPFALIIGHAAFAFAPHFPLIVIGAFFGGLGAGMITPGYSAAASLAVSKAEQGAIAGLSNSAGATGFILAPPIGLGFYQLSPHAPFMLTTVVAIGMAVAAWRFLETD